MCNYATKSVAKQVKGIDTPNVAKKADLYSLKSKVDKLDIHDGKSISRNVAHLNILVPDMINLLY